MTPLNRLVAVADFQEEARRRLPQAIADYIDGGAGHESTVRSNELAFARWVFKPRQLTDVAKPTTEVSILGRPLALPVVCGPSGMQRLVSRRGEVDAVRAVAKAGGLYVLGVASSCSLEDVATAGHGARLWFQVHPMRDRQSMSHLLDRAAAAGYEALCITIDSKSPGGRKYRDMRHGMTTVPFRLSPRTTIDVLQHPRWLYGFLSGPPVRAVHLTDPASGKRAASLFNTPVAMQTSMDPSATWDDMRWVRGQWRGPMIVKGVLTAEDARNAIAAGAEAIVCSNHGGRMLDGLPATMAALPRVVEAAGSAEVYLDGGVRTGGDVVKALAVGAKACLVARPFWWGLAIGGEEGVRRVLEIYRAEILGTLAQIGRQSAKDLSRDDVEPGLPQWN
jgi:isopentenyl diphosphate isomerase/L-lactate dehydrogenase-like FMN-dependent dehydrogenase